MSETYHGKIYLNMIDFNLLSARKELFARITGVKLAEFLMIVEKVRPSWDKIQVKKKCHGRNSNLKTLENEILLVILYYRYYTSHYFLGMQFNLDASNFDGEAFISAGGAADVHFDAVKQVRIVSEGEAKTMIEGSSVKDAYLLDQSTNVMAGTKSKTIQQGKVNSVGY